ncbi:MAG: hypothetical protein ACI9UA_000513, partial [Pseudoalteromonas tetraodonis]
LGTSVGYFDAGDLSTGTWAGNPASNVTDRNLTNFTHSLDQSRAGYCVQVNLGADITIGSIDVTGRTDGCCPERLEDATLELYDSALNLVRPP